MSVLAPRPAAPSDLDWIEPLSRRRFAAAWSRASLEAELTRPDSLFLVVKERGYLLARLSEDGCAVLDFAVAEDGLGWGRALWACAVAEAGRRGVRRLTLEVSSANARALAFYAKAGATVVGRRAKFYTDGSDAVLMDVALP